MRWICVLLRPFASSRRQSGALSGAFVFGLVLASMPVGLIHALPARGETSAQEVDDGLCNANDGKVVCVAVLYRESEAGSRQRTGVIEALEHYAKSAKAGSVEIVLEPFGYGSEEEGYEALRRIVEGYRFHLVLGPTDSGVFVQGARYIDPASLQRMTPVISSNVTASAGNEKSSWFFRTNVAAAGRARAIYKYLDALGFSSIAVFYSDTEFGRRAEAAFRSGLRESQRQRFISIRYSSDDRDTVLSALQGIFDYRPGAIGIFGQRSEIEWIHGEINDLNRSLNPYTPLTFSIVDVRALRRKNLHFVSVVSKHRPEQASESATEEDGGASLDLAELDDVKALSYDTASLVFDMLGDLKAPLDAKLVSADLRNRILNTLSGPPAGKGAWYTDMRFENFENQAKPKVFSLEGDRFRKLGPPVSRGWAHGARSWLDIRFRRFGWAPLLNVALVIAIAAWVSVIDLRRWNRNRSRFVGWSKPFLIFVAFNSATAVVVLIVLCETAWMRWDNTIAAVGVALGYSALLKANVFQSQAGEATGLAGWYASAVQWINDRIMLEKWRRESGKVNYIAFANSLEYLKERVLEIYDFASNGGEDDERVRELAEEEAKAISTIDKRRVYARRALAMMSWSMLQEKKLVRADVAEDGVLDAEAVVQLSALHCIEDRKLEVAAMRRLALKTLEEVQDEPDAFERAKSDLQDDLRTATTKRAKFATYLRWLFIQHGFDTRRLAQDDLLPADWEKQLRPRRIPQIKVGRNHEPAPAPFEEKRASVRVRVGSPISIRLAAGENGEGGGELPGKIRNVSEGGACVVVLDTERSPGLDIAGDPIALSANEGLFDTLEAAGKLQYVKEEDDLMVFGLSWSNLDQDFRDRIAELIETAELGLAPQPTAAGEVA